MTGTDPPNGTSCLIQRGDAADGSEPMLAISYAAAFRVGPPRRPIPERRGDTLGQASPSVGKWDSWGFAGGGLNVGSCGQQQNISTPRLADYLQHCGSPAVLVSNPRLAGSTYGNIR